MLCMPSYNQIIHSSFSLSGRLFSYILIDRKVRYANAYIKNIIKYFYMLLHIQLGLLFSSIEIRTFNEYISSILKLLKLLVNYL